MRVDTRPKRNDFGSRELRNQFKPDFPDCLYSLT
jgi:hypothetical protein